MESTHTALMEQPALVADGDFLRAVSQTAGRGQRGNHWESEPDRNLTFSLPLHPHDFQPQEQFLISEAFALAIIDFLDETASKGIHPSIKWPNDIYVGDRKICGILISHSLAPGRIVRSVLSAGVNINQMCFRSDAPNPVSLARLTGLKYDLDAEMRRIHRKIEGRIGMFRRALAEEEKEALHSEYMSRLYRCDGELYPFHDHMADEEILASIENIDRDGRLHLRLADGSERSYLFKQISFMLPNR